MTEHAPGFHVPEVSHLLNFAPLFSFKVGSMEFHVTFITLVMFGLTFLLVGLFIAAFRSPTVIPGKLQNALEASVDAVKEQIVAPILGPDSDRFMPLLTSMFFFVFAMNFMEIVPPVQFPLSSRMAIPAFMAGMTYVIFNYLGIRNQGPIKYFTGILFPPGVPKFIYVILTPIEFMSTFIFRPLTMAVRLFANMMAGHVMLTIFFLASAYFLYGADSIFLRVIFPFPFVLSIVLTGFELFIGLIQAFIITILAAVYIQGALHPEH